MGNKDVVAEERRSTSVRLGIVALDLLAPGLGWFRLGRWRAAITWLALTAIVFSVFLAIMALAPTPGFYGYVIFMGMVILVSVAMMIVPMIITWRESKFRGGALPWWTRWYALAVIWLMLSLVSQLVPLIGHSYYKPFYAAAGSMAPTISADDKVLVDMRSEKYPMVRGALLAVEANGQIRLARLIGLPGDRVAIRRGIPVVDGIASLQRFDGIVRDHGFEGVGPMQRLVEKLPGEEGSHAIFDSGYMPELDDFAETTVPSGHVFVMGDNRDMAADSRVAPYRNGIGLPSISAIVGRPLFIYWSRDYARIGASLI